MNTASTEMLEGEVLLAEQVGGALARWQLPSFDVPRESGPKPPTAQQLEAIEAAAYQDGFQRGQADGFTAGQQSAIAQAQRLQGLIDHIARPLTQLDEEVEQALSALVSAVARRVISDELTVHPERILGIVRDVLAGLPPQLRTLRLHVQADDAALLKEHFQPPVDVQDFAIVTDASLLRGDCRVVTESSLIDGRLQTRLEQVMQAVEGDGA